MTGMMISWREAIQHFEARISQTQALIARYDQLRDAVAAHINDLQTPLTEARRALAAAYLAVLERPALERTERLTGFRGFSRRDPFQAMEQRRTTLEKAVRRIEADVQYQRRVGLVGPGGEYIEKLKEINDMASPFEAECARFEGQPRFLELYEAGYDSPNFKLAWWQAEYWKMWAAGDRICASLGMKDFGDDVRPAYEAAVKERTFWLSERVRVEGRINDVHGLVEEHDRSVALLGRLGEVILEECWDALSAFFEHADPALLESWLVKEPTEDRAVLVTLRRMAGLSAKQALLRELRDLGLKTLLDDLAKRLQRYNSRRNKLLNSSKMRNRPVQSAFLDHAFEAKRLKLGAQVEVVGRQVQKLVQAEKYERFELSNAPSLWWGHLTGSRPPRLLPRVRTWYDRNPGAAITLAAPAAGKAGKVRGGADAPLSDAAVALVVSNALADADGGSGYLS